MGYTTDFIGQLQFDNPLMPAQVAYIQAFNSTRRIKRDSAKAETLKDDLRIAVELPIGNEGGYYVGSYYDGNSGQNGDISTLNGNEPPKGQPGLWCQWTVSDDGSVLEWDGGEKFYNYVEWLQYLIDNFFNKWNAVLNGEIEWEGEDSSDRGKIIVYDNVVKTKKGKIVYD